MAERVKSSSREGHARKIQDYVEYIVMTAFMVIAVGAILPDVIAAVSNTVSNIESATTSSESTSEWLHALVKAL